ncbi:Transcription initiation factor IIA small chain (TFIIA 13.5 kDa subunit) [Puccinia graminis f. sp. tritici]|uniref:Transcription initiation factor IIA small chain (TFIIA 13.5 kDa subunit) n=1 Tax=Puccinia graminis f. sp. tritici TaxID=56615 RepID=A0A5B0NAQ4_PUCGR|nr:Transcription initiation factor IIA small chain (TFIIA 13.5 kDa subunit) [Puccinia graminis f. sp. tritici]
MFEKLENCTASTQHLQGWWLVGSTNSGTKHRKVVLCKKNLVTVGFEPTHLAIEDLKTAALDQLGQMTMESPGKNEYMFRRPPNDRPIFDKSASQVLSTQLRSKCTVKGHLSTYRLCDEVWTFLLHDSTFKLEGGDSVGPVKRVKIVACKGNPNAGPAQSQ